MELRTHAGAELRIEENDSGVPLTINKKEEV